MRQSAHDLSQTFDCKTPGCAGSARSRTGRHAYCLPCRVRRGTALPDGTPIEATSKALSRRRKDKAIGPFEHRALALVEAGRNLDLQVERYRLARPGLEQAAAAWCEIVEQLDALKLDVASQNGASPDN